MTDTQKGVAIFLGVLFAFISGLIIANILDEINKNRPTLGEEENEYGKIKIPCSELADNWLGWTERLLSFTAAWLGQYVIIGGWLTFKIAAKWENWKNIIQINKRDMPSIKVRRYLGAYVYTRFLIGTGLNILSGIISFKLASYCARLIY